MSNQAAPVAVVRKVFVPSKQPSYVGSNNLDDESVVLIGNNKVAPHNAPGASNSVDEEKPGSLDLHYQPFIPDPVAIPTWKHPYPFTPFHRSQQRELELLRAKERVGVPGHRQYNYESYKEAAFTYAGTIWEVIFCRWMFWLYMIAFVVTITFNTVFYDTFWLRLFRLEPWITSTLLNASIFTITFYNSSVYVLYRQRFNEVFKLNGSMTALTALCYRMVRSNYAKAFALLRYANSMIFVNYSLMEGPMNDAKWDIMKERKLLTDEEIGLLKSAGNNYSTILLTWAAEIVRGAVEVGMLVDIDMISHLSTVRGLSAKQIGMTRLQVPKPYYHCMWLCMQLFLVTCIWRAGNNWGDAMRGTCELSQDRDDGFNPCYWSGVISLIWSWFTIVVIFGLYRVGVMLSDPYGEDSTDYDLGTDLDALWTESLRVMQLTCTRGVPGPVSAKFEKEA